MQSNLAVRSNNAQANPAHTRSYLFLIFQIINMVLERAALSEKSCARLIRFVNGPPVVTFICGSVIFIQRLYAIYGKSLRVCIPL